MSIGFAVILVFWTLFAIFNLFMRKVKAFIEKSRSFALFFSSLLKRRLNSILRVIMKTWGWRGIWKSGAVIKNGRVTVGWRRFRVLVEVRVNRSVLRGIRYFRDVVELMVHRARLAASPRSRNDRDRVDRHIPRFSEVCCLLQRESLMRLTWFAVIFIFLCGALYNQSLLTLLLRTRFISRWKTCLRPGKLFDCTFGELGRYAMGEVVSPFRHLVLQVGLFCLNYSFKVAVNNSVILNFSLFFHWNWKFLLQFLLEGKGFLINYNSKFRPAI